ncbi:MAG: cytochrome P450 [Catenulispora sp.]|nr:cytochrome P450 [Catenulispora sp.]NUR57234.1 cytochrome P450 [Catenulispora sp.]
MFRTTVDGAEAVLVVAPEGLQELFSRERGRLEVLNTPLVHDLFGQALFNLTEDHHAEARRRVRPALSSRAIPGYVDALLEVADRAAASWTGRLQPDLYAASRHVTFAMSARVLLGVDAEDTDGRRLQAAFRRFVIATSAPSGHRRYLAARYWAGMRTRRHLHDLVIRLAGTADSHCVGSALPLLAERFQAAPAAAGPLSDHLLALLIAARETTASLITWSLIELAQAPGPARLAMIEARGAASRPERLTDPGALPMLRAVVAESLRLHSPNLLSQRRVLAPLTVCGVDIPAGTTVAYSPSAGHFDADVFSQPNDFIPERFLPGAASPARLWAFGGGLHACLGRALAEVMALSVLVSVLNQGLPQLPDGPPEAVRHRPAKAPAHPVPFVVQPDEETA